MHLSRARREVRLWLCLFPATHLFLPRLSQHRVGLDANTLNSVHHHDGAVAQPGRSGHLAAPRGGD